MLITLIKVANKLDALGEHELASELDTVMQGLLSYAGKDRDKLLADLKEVEERLEGDVSVDRLKELAEAKKNIEDDLAKLDEDKDNE